MQKLGGPFSRSFRPAIALLCGGWVGVVLVTVYEFARAAIERAELPLDVHPIMTAKAVAEAAFLFSIYYAAMIVLICAPLWLLLARFRVNGPLAAATLGFVATYLVSTYADYPAIETLGSGLPYAACGALAGLATWWAGSSLS
jgi:hypothetical protein